MVRKPKKWVVYVLHYADDNLFKVWCSLSKDWAKKRLNYWNCKLQSKWIIYAIMPVSDKYREERLLIWDLFKTHKCLYTESVELFFDVKEEIDYYFDNHIFL